MKRKNLFLLLTIVLIIYISACSTTKHYKTLSFFFDGVPDPAKKEITSSNDSIKTIDSSTFAQQHIAAPLIKGSNHPPFQERECNSCHDAAKSGKLIIEMPDVCYQCHIDFNLKYKYLHGPVASGACNICHNPHTSSNEKLLNRTGQSLCLYCHNADQVMKNEVHKEINETNCLECHNPHGGDDINILR